MLCCSLWIHPTCFQKDLQLTNADYLYIFQQTGEAANQNSMKVRCLKLRSIYRQRKTLFILFKPYGGSWSIHTASSCHEGGFMYNVDLCTGGAAFSASHSEGGMFANWGQERALTQLFFFLNPFQPICLLPLMWWNGGSPPRRPLELCAEIKYYIYNTSDLLSLRLVQERLPHRSLMQPGSGRGWRLWATH